MRVGSMGMKVGLRLAISPGDLNEVIPIQYIGKREYIASKITPMIMSVFFTEILNLIIHSPISGKNQLFKFY